MSEYLAKYKCTECGHEEYYDSDLEMGEDFCAYCEECTGDLVLIPRQVRFGATNFKSAVPTAKEAGERLNVLVRVAQKYKETE